MLAFGLTLVQISSVIKHMCGKQQSFSISFRLLLLLLHVNVSFLSAIPSNFALGHSLYCVHQHASRPLGARAEPSSGAWPPILVDNSDKSKVLHFILIFKKS